MTFKLKGVRKMQGRMRGISRQFPGQVEAALRTEAEKIMTDAKQNYVPVGDGVLRSSGHAKDPVRKGKDISIDMVFGGAAAAYALTVHENPSVHDPPTWKGAKVQFGPGERGPKYLRKPMDKATPTMARRIAARLQPRDALGRFTKV